MGALSAVRLLVWKDLTLELRTKEILTAMAVFALLAAVIFNFAFSPSPSQAVALLPGMLWVTLAFASTLVERAGEYEHVIALGDYNLRGDEQGYLIVDAVYVNAWMSTYPTGVSPDGTDMSCRNRIDHIFVSESFTVVNPIYVLPPDSWTDHPVHWTDLTWQD